MDILLLNWADRVDQEVPSVYHIDIGKIIAIEVNLDFRFVENNEELLIFLSSIPELPEPLKTIILKSLSTGIYAF